MKSVMTSDIVSTNITYGEDLVHEFRRGTHENLHKVKQVYPTVPGIRLNRDLYKGEISFI